MMGFVSCATQKKCNQKFPPSRDTMRIVETKDTIIYRDTILYKYLPGETKYDTITIQCPPPPPSYIPDTAYAETSFAEARAWWSYPFIKLMLDQKDTTLLLKASIKEAMHWRSEYEKVTTIPQPIVTKYIPGFFKFCTYAFCGMIIAAIGYFILKFIVKI